MSKRKTRDVADLRLRKPLCDRGESVEARKVFITEYNDETIPSSSNLFEVSDIEEGHGNNQRTGPHVYYSHIRLRLQLYLNKTTVLEPRSPYIVKVSLIWDKSPLGASSAEVTTGLDSEIYNTDATQTHTMRDWNQIQVLRKKGRFKVLGEKTVSLTPYHMLTGETYNRRYHKLVNMNLDILNYMSIFEQTTSRPMVGAIYLVISRKLSEPSIDLDLRMNGSVYLYFDHSPLGTKEQKEQAAGEAERIINQEGQDEQHLDHRRPYRTNDGPDDLFGDRRPSPTIQLSFSKSHRRFYSNKSLARLTFALHVDPASHVFSTLELTTRRVFVMIYKEGRRTKSEELNYLRSLRKTLQGILDTEPRVLDQLENIDNALHPHRIQRRPRHTPVWPLGTQPPLPALPP